MNLNTTGDSWSTLSMLGQFILLIIVFLIILFLAYYFTKLFSTFKYKSNKKSNLKIIESVGVGYQSTIQLIKVGDKVILIGVTKDKINYICDVNEDSINMEVNSIKIDIPDTFQKYLQNFMDKKNDKKEK
jgi:flagellar protein FliO/FliZ